MSGEKNLQKLLLTMEPRLRDEDYVFVSFENAKYGDFAYLEPIAMFQEEALSLVIPKSRADQHSVEYQSVFKCISLTVHSSLDAVGLTAAIATKLTEHGISANVIAGYFHDHVFVQARSAQKAFALLANFSE